MQHSLSSLHSPIDVKVSRLHHPGLLSCECGRVCTLTGKHRFDLLKSVAAVQVRKDEIDLLYNLLDINRDGLLELKEVVKSQERLGGKPFDDTLMKAAARAA